MHEFQSSIPFFYYLLPTYITTLAILLASLHYMIHHPRNSISRSIASHSMSSRRSSRHSSSGGSSSRISDDQIVDLISKLQQILPEIQTHNNPSTNRRSTKVSATKVLQETCNYIRELNREVEDLSARLSQLLSTVDHDSPEAAIIRSLIMHS